MTQYWLGLDCGGSWLKAGLYDREGREAGVQRLPLCALSPQPGWAERDMAELWQCCTAVIRALLTHSGVSGEQIVGIGISAQGKGLFLLDKNDKPLGNAILSSDRRAMEIVRRWQKDGIPEKLYPLTRQTLDRASGVAVTLAERAQTRTLRANWLRDDDARLPALVFNRRQRLRREQYF